MEDLKTEAWRASGSGPCRDSGRRAPRRRGGVWGWEGWGPSRPTLSAPRWVHHLGLSGAPQLGQHVLPPQPVGGPLRLLPPPEAGRVAGVSNGPPTQETATPQRITGVLLAPHAKPALVGRAGDSQGLNCSQNHPSASGQAPCRTPPVPNSPQLMRSSQDWEERAAGEHPHTEAKVRGWFCGCSPPHLPPILGHPYTPWLASGSPNPLPPCNYGGWPPQLI